MSVLLVCKLAILVSLERMLIIRISYIVQSMKITTKQYVLLAEIDI